MRWGVALLVTTGCSFTAPAAPGDGQPPTPDTPVEVPDAPIDLPDAPDARPDAPPDATPIDALFCIGKDLIEELLQAAELAALLVVARIDRRRGRRT